MTEVTLKPICFTCYSYTPRPPNEKVTVIVAPIRIQERDGATHISWACSQASACTRTTCRYSKGRETLLYEDTYT